MIVSFIALNTATGFVAGKGGGLFMNKEDALWVVVFTFSSKSELLVPDR